MKRLLIYLFIILNFGLTIKASANEIKFKQIQINTNEVYKKFGRDLIGVIEDAVSYHNRFYPNVMKAWGDNQNVGDKVFMAADPYCEFTKSIVAEIDRKENGFGMRSARYTMLIENNIIKSIKLEEDTAVCEISAAENFIKEI